jgi:dolichol-phosphate mannosyltransferase
MNEALVIIPTYNEIENISNIIDAVMQLEDGFDVLVIDDASPDGTQEAVKEKIVEYPERIHLETRTGKLGLGTAYITAMNISSRWMLISHTIRMTCRDYIMNAKTVGLMYV